MFRRIVSTLSEVVIKTTHLRVGIYFEEEIMSNTTNSQQQNTSIGPGQELRQAREALGKSVEEVASELFINKQRLTDIENDDYSKISSLIYAKGYLQAYAKLVGLFEDDILKKFDDLGLHEKRVPANLDIIASPRTKLDKRHIYVKLTNMAIAIILILLVVLWWQDKKRAAFSQQTSFKNPVQEVTIPAPLNNILS